ncbi:hypothetical protein LguiB_012648 [Lonicera macranthoides]
MEEEQQHPSQRNRGIAAKEKPPPPPPPPPPRRPMRRKTAFPSEDLAQLISQIQKKEQAPRRVIARPTTSPSGQNGEAEPVEMSVKDAACTFCYCILKVGNNMFLRKCNCQRERPILAHEECTNNNPQPNEPCSQCNEPIQNIPMTLDRVPVPRNRMKGFGRCFGSTSN